MDYISLLHYMCGISGIIGKLNVDFNKFNDSLTHRGQDAAGVFENQDKTIKLGHRRLSIIDLSNHANQPMISECGNYVLVFNGEIYNFKKLKSEFNLQCKTSSDTEVILQLYLKIGDKVCEYLNGMFAFAIYNIAKNQILF